MIGLHTLGAEFTSMLGGENGRTILHIDTV
jgi:hypothetical protein